MDAILVRFRRPDLIRSAPFRKALPWIGLAWLVFPVWIYVFWGVIIVAGLGLIGHLMAHPRKNRRSDSN